MNFSGINPNKEWKESKLKQPWYVGETVITSIGQGNMHNTSSNSKIHRIYRNWKTCKTTF